MIRDFQLADLLTLSNAFMGTTSILCVMKFLVSGEHGFLWGAFGVLPFALMFDVLDGRVARWREETSLLGQELDSLADAVSFGVAPAALAFAMGMRGAWDCLVLVYFVGCGISRLARYNATAAQLSDDTGKVKYFEGTPIPSTLILAATLGILALRNGIGARLPGGELNLGPWVLHPLVVLYALSGSAMISKTLRIPKP
jgi:CDP-diacylglycerol--serine O-phosphatidyltransferase